MMDEVTETVETIIYVAIAVFVIGYIVNMNPSAFDGIRVNTMTTALLLLIPTGGWFVLKQLEGF